MNGCTRGVSERAQTGLPALAIALLVLTMVTGIGLALADGAIGAADREPGERRVAVSLAAGLVAPESPLTERANVLDEERLSNVDQRRLRTAFPVTDETAVRVELDGDPLVTTGTTRTGTTIRRLVVVEERTTERVEPSLGWQRRVTLPQRGAGARLTLVPPAGTNVTTVRANDRVEDGQHRGFGLARPGGRDHEGVLPGRKRRDGAALRLRRRLEAAVGQCGADRPTERRKGVHPL